MIPTKIVEFVQKINPSSSMPDNLTFDAWCFFGSPYRRFSLIEVSGYDAFLNKYQIHYVYDLITGEHTEATNFPSKVADDKIIYNLRKKIRSDFNYYYSFIKEVEEDLNTFHPYLREQKIKVPSGVKSFSSYLIVPGKNIHTGRIESCVLISEKGEFLPRGEIDNCYFLFGDFHKDIFVTDDFPTACTLYKETGNSVLYSMTDNNVLPLAINLSERFPLSKVFICLKQGSNTESLQKRIIKELKEKSIFNIFLSWPRIKSVSPKLNTFHHLCCLDREEFLKQIDALLNSITSNFVQVLGKKEMDIYTYSPQTGIKKFPYNLKKESLQTMADLEYWEALSGKSKIGQVKWDSATRMIREAAFKKEFNHYRYRTMGIYLDSGSLLINTGQSIIGNPSGDYFYLKNPISTWRDRLPHPKQALDESKLADFYTTLKKLHFSNEWGACMLISWMIYAPFFQCFDFRPHLSLEGVSSSGKGWVQKNVLYRFLSWHYPEHYYGHNTTISAFLKQEQFRPRITFLEEKEDDEGNYRHVQTKGDWLEAFRLSATEKNANFKKSDRNDGLAFYPLRFIVCLCAINPILNKEEDKYRFVEVPFQPKPDTKSYLVLKRIKDMNLRSISLGCYTRIYNSFKEFDKKRERYYIELLGLGINGHPSNKWAIMLAVAEMFLLNTKELLKFKKFIIESEQNAEKEGESYEDILYSIMTFPIFTYPTQKSLLDCLNSVRRNEAGNGITFDNKEILLQGGIKIKGDKMYLSKKAFIIKKIFQYNKEYKNTWFKILRENFKYSNNVRFANSIKFSSIEIQLAKVLDSMRNERALNFFRGKHIVNPLPTEQKVSKNYVGLAGKNNEVPF